VPASNALLMLTTSLCGAEGVLVPEDAVDDVAAFCAPDERLYPAGN
jgi:hypothetical protein